MEEVYREKSEEPTRHAMKISFNRGYFAE